MSTSAHAGPPTPPPDSPAPSVVPLGVSTDLPGSPSVGRDARTVLGAVLPRPDLWWTALGELRRMAPRLWWRSSPHLPLPDRRLWEFRMVTAYGRSDAAPTGADVISFLEWCRATSAPSTSRPGRNG